MGNQIQCRNEGKDRMASWASTVGLIAFDADDTLWDNQGHFDAVEQAYCRLLSPYGTAEQVSAALFETETANMSLLGYGCKAFTLSLIENAVSFSKGQITTRKLLEVEQLGKSLLSLPVTPLAGVVNALRALRQIGRYRLVVFTKGELLDQQNKVIRSGLRAFFDDVIVVSDKTRHEYQRLCDMFDTDVSRLLMVGNSFKSDIAPVLQLGGYAVHIPFDKVWQHEVVEEYEHPRLRRLQSISDLPSLLAI